MTTGHPGIADDTQVVEVRCPRDHYRPDGTCNPGRLLGQLILAGEDPSYLQPDNLIVLACNDCKRWQRREGRNVRRVLHCYNLAGQLVKTLTENDPPGEDPPG